jgi:hypothetical protein
VKSEAVKELSLPNLKLCNLGSNPESELGSTNSKKSGSNFYTSAYEAF